MLLWLEEQLSISNMPRSLADEMRALLLLTDLYDATGGIQSFNRSIVESFAEIAKTRNWRITALVLNDSPRSEGQSTCRNEMPVRYQAFGGNKIRFARAALAHGCRAALIYFGHVNFASLALLLEALNAKTRSVVAVYGIEAWHRLPLTQRLAVKRMSRILAISEYTKWRMLSSNNLRAEAFAILPCTLQPGDERRHTRLTRRELALPDGRMILSVSRLDAMERYKGIDEVICVLPSVLQRCCDAFYVVVGDGTDRARLEDLARQVGVSERVYFTGRVSDELLAAYYQTSDLFVLPSTHEGFGIVFLEAMARAKACIGANAGATSEVIKHGETGLLIEPNNRDQLSRFLVELLANDAQRQAMGVAAACRYRIYFSSQRFYQRFEEIIGALAEGRG